MALSGWGSSEWDVDKTAETLNKDLFGGKKKNNKGIIVPDCDVDTKGDDNVHDSDEEHFSKKAKKRMKDKIRKLKKKVNEGTTPSKDSTTTNPTKDDQKKETGEKENSNEEVSSKKKRKKKKKNTSENSVENAMNEGKESNPNKIGKSLEADSKEASNDDKTEGKRKRKRKLETSPEKIVSVKKIKIAGDANKDETNNEKQEEKKKKRPNRKKKNNCKNNKYKHLALNSKSKNETDLEKTDNSAEKIGKSATDSITQTPTKDSKSLMKKDMNNQSEAPTNSSKKNKNKKRKANSVNTEEAMETEPSSNDVNSEDKRKVRKKGNGDELNLQQNKLSKQKLINMLGNSSSDNTEKQLLSKDISDISVGVSKKQKRRDRIAARKALMNGKGDDADGHNDKSENDNSSTAKGDSQPSTPLGIKEKAVEKLNAARFRYLNEQLYTCKGHDAMQLFRQDKEAFNIYHQGFQSQAAKWPVNPLDTIIKHIKNRPKQLIVADFGCGDARLSQSVEQKVHSFDLIALNKRVTACNMSKTPLADDSVDIAVFCLSLMGTNLNDYVLEANRVLKAGGLLKIAEVMSRFSSPEHFIKQVTNLGFLLLNKRELKDMFCLIDFKKVKRVKKSPSNANIKLKPCVYKKR